MDGHYAPRSTPVSEEEWEKVNKFNRDLVEEYIANQTYLSPKSLFVYESALKMYFVWVKNNLDNKKCIDIKKKEFMRYMNWLNGRELSEATMRFRKSSVSAFNKYIENYYEDEYPMFRNYVTSEMQVPKTGAVFEKEPLTPDEMNYLCEVLEDRDEWQKIAYVKFSYSTGCRRAEAWQLLKEVVDYAPNIHTITITDEDGKEKQVESVSYKTHNIRCKGSSRQGKIRKLQFGQDVMDALKKWIEVRGDDDCPYMFVNTEGDTVTHLTESALNSWCKNEFSTIIGRRVTPHSFRRSRATNLVVYDHRPIETAQKLLGHESPETTQVYVIREDTDDADDAFIDDDF